MKTIHSLTLVLVAGFAVTASQNANAAVGKAFFGKIETREHEKPGFTRFASGYFVDENSIKGDSMHPCSGKTYFVTTNDYFKGYSTGEKAKIKLQTRFDSATGEQNVYIDVEGSLKGRDYFSGAALLEIDTRAVENELSGTGYQLHCLSLINSGSNSQWVRGFQYYSLNYQELPISSLTDRGLKGGLVLDSSKTVAHGMVIGDYFKAGAASEPLQTTSLRNVGEYAARVFRNQIQSSKGLMYYMPDTESFVYKGAKDAFVMAPEKADGTGRVKIIGSPEEVLVDSRTKQDYLDMSRSNAFSGLGTTFGAAEYYLSMVDGQPIANWKQAVDIFTNPNYVERSSKPIIEFEVKSNNRSSKFLVGERFQEYVSIIKWIGVSNDAIYDQPRRPLKDNEAAVINQMSAPASRMYEIFASYNPLSVNAMDKNAKEKLFGDFLRQAQLIVDSVTDPKTGLSKFDERSSRTLFKVQQYAQELRKWVEIERAKMGRDSVINVDQSWHGQTQ